MARRLIAIAECIPFTAQLNFQVPFKVYKRETYQGIVDRLYALQSKYPKIVRVYIASEELNVPAYGHVCAHVSPVTNSETSTCEIYIAEIDTGDTGNLTYGFWHARPC